jgi:predicted DNA-binding protein
MRNPNTTPTKQISIRLPARDHERLVIESEKQGTTVAEIARQRIQQAEKQLEMKDLIASLLKHLTKTSFVVTSSVAGLDAQERQAALKHAEKMLGRKI